MRRRRRRASCHSRGRGLRRRRHGQRTQRRRRGHRRRFQHPGSRCASLSPCRPIANRSTIAAPGFSPIRRSTLPRMRLTRAEQLVVYAPLALLVTTFLFLPAVLGLLAAFTNYGPIQPDVRWVGLRNFQTVLADRSFAAAIRNIGAFTVAAVSLQLSLGFALAYAMRLPFRGRGTVRVLLLVPWLISPVAAGVMWRFLLGSETGFLSFASRFVGLPATAAPPSQHGLALLTVVLIETWRVAPLVAFLVLPAITAIPGVRWADAAIDGLSTRTTIRHVVLPATRPLMLALALLLIGGAFGTFDSILTLTGGGPGTETTTPALYAYDKAFQFGDWPIGAAAGWLIGGAVLLVGLIYHRLPNRDR